MNKKEYETVKISYEHRVIEEHNAGPYYKEDYIFHVGDVLKKTYTPTRYKEYSQNCGHGVDFYIPSEKVGIFKITKTTHITEEEERI